MRPKPTPLLQAISYSAIKHKDTESKGDSSVPYIAHVFRVVAILSERFGVHDEEVLTAAALHDLIEKGNNVDFDKINEKFGEKIAGWASYLSVDKRLPEEKADQLYGKNLLNGPYQVQLIKLADLYDNLLEAVEMKKNERQKKLAKWGIILKYLKKTPHDAVKAHLKVVLKAFQQLQTIK